jgi:hypothetical protein
MAYTGAIPPYPEPSKPAMGEPYPATGGPPPGPMMAQYVQYPIGEQPRGLVYMQPGYVDPSINQIRDWLPWSITNIFLGWLLIGFIPLIFSIICRSRKRANNASGARTMGTFALIANILVTLAGIAAWIGLIVAVSLAHKAVSSVGCYNSYYNNC